MEIPKNVVDAVKYDELSIAWNKMRQKNANESFDKDSISILLLDNNFPYNANALCVYCREGVLIRVKKGVYKFTNTPVYIEKLKDTLYKIHNYTAKYRKTDTKPIKKPVSIKGFSDKELIEELKSRHYRVYKREISYQEV